MCGGGAILHTRDDARERVNEASDRAAENDNDKKDDAKSEKWVVFHPGAPLIVLIRERAGQDPGEDLGAVERRHRNEVEETKPEIDQNADEADRSERGISPQTHQNSEYDDECEISSRSCGRNDGLAPARGFCEIEGIVGHRLRPSEKEAAGRKR